jgi:glycosyltransferase involved in cell wall biosynthesis
MISPGSRIGVVTTSYPTGENDYAGGFVAAHVEALLQAGHRVDVFAAGSTAAAQMNVVRVVGSATLFASGGAPDAIERGTAATWLSAASFSARLAAQVAAHRNKWDAVIAHWMAPCGVAALASRGPLLCVAHGGDIHLLSRTGLMTGVIAGLAARQARLQFVSTQAQRQTLEATRSAVLRRYIERSSIVCAMGLNTAAFKEIRTQCIAGTTPTHREILIVGRLVPIKGIDIAIASLAHIAHPIRLTIAGGGPLFAALHAAALELMAIHPRHKIEFAGVISPMQRNALLARCCVVVIPSRVLANGRCEGTPQIALEAMASGVPVVVSSTGGLADLPQSIRKVATDDPRLLAQAIVDALASPPSPRQLQADALNYDWTTVAAKMIAHWFSTQ